MTDSISIFESEYIIDGIRRGVTPGQMLRECMPYPYGAGGEDGAKGCIMDETVDRTPSSFSYDGKDIGRYKELTVNAARGNRHFRTNYPETFTRQRIAGTLLDTIWKNGHFRLDNLVLDASWEWNTAPIGNMAAFYTSVKSASEYIYDLGVSLREYSFKKTDGKCEVEFSIGETSANDEDDGTEPFISPGRICPDTMIPDKTGWLIYIPFDSCAFRLGGSLLAEASGHDGGTAPDIKDPDYFIDCYEVIRELAEDGVIVAGRTVGDGGLAAAAEKMCSDAGISLNISGIESAYQENDIVRILFSEIPGVLIQIEDSDYDYIDAQMLLQDIAYYPLGHPSADIKGAEILRDGRSGVAGILAALLQGLDSGVAD